MSAEMYFVYGLLAFVLIGIALEAERFVGPRVSWCTKLFLRQADRLERRYPKMCGSGDSFYAFFRRDRFKM